LAQTVDVSADILRSTKRSKFVNIGSTQFGGDLAHLRHELLCFREPAGKGVTGRGYSHCRRVAVVHSQCPFCPGRRFVVTADQVVAVDTPTPSQRAAPRADKPLSTARIMRMGKSLE